MFQIFNREIWNIFEEKQNMLLSVSAIRTQRSSVYVGTE